MHQAPRKILPENPDFEKLRPYFGWVPLERIQATLKNATQWFKAEGRLPLRRHFKTRFPAANVSRLNEVVATDTFFSNIEAFDDGQPSHGGTTMLQIYTGVTSHFTQVFPMRSEAQMPSTLQDFIRSCGAPVALFSDNAKVQVGLKVQDILCHYL